MVTFTTAIMHPNLTSFEEIEERSVIENVLLCLLMALIIVAAVVGNVAVIVAITTNLRLKDEVANIFIINLSITDLLSAVVVMVSAFVSLAANQWPFGQGWCDIVCMANYWFIIVSMMSLCFISIDRYIAVVHPLHYINLMTKKKILLMIAYSWFQGAVFAVVPVVFHWIKYDYWEAVCAIQWHHQRKQALYYVITAFILCFLLPGLILIVCYSRVLKTARAKTRAIAACTSVSRTSVKYTTSSKAMYGLLIVVVAFFVCMTPFSTTKLFKVAVPKDNVLPNYVNLSASIIAYLSSAVNPLIYGIFRKDFRDAFKLMYRKYLARRTVAPSPKTDSLHLSEIS